jgi:hypothetical protein
MLLYKRIAFADSPFNPTATQGEWINANQNSLSLDCDTTAGDIIVNLPTINSLIYGTNNGAGGLSFYIKGNIVAGANNLTFAAGSGDSICGVSSTSIGVNRTGSCFHLFVAGRNIWGFLSCINT